MIKPLLWSIGRKFIQGLPEGAIPLEYRLHGKTGSWEWIQSRATTLKRDAQGKPAQILVNLTVITERKKVQEKLEEALAQLERYAAHMEQLAEERAIQLKEAGRLAAIGATAGMVGHDIRNPLQAIASDVYLLKSDLSTMPEGEMKLNVRDSLEGIERNVFYINKIVADLQDFARPLNPQVDEVDLKLLIDELLAENVF